VSLRDEQARAERDASALRSILSRYPDAKREDGATGIVIASVPMSAVTEVSVDVGKGGRPFVRFGDGEISTTVWQADGYEVADLLEALLDVPGGREALAKATEPNR
jgi:hypothetical protein